MATSMDFVKRANRLMEKLEFLEAEQCFKKALDADDRSASALVGLARLALMGKRPDDALQLLDRTLALHPNYAEALAVKGLFFMERQDFDSAIEIMEQAKALDPNLPMIHFNLGKCFSELGRFDKAEPAFLKVIEMNPKHFEAYSQLSYVQMKTGRMEDGMRSMLEAIRINRFYIKGYLIIGALYESVGKGDLVIRLYRDGLKYNPNAFQLRERLCSLYALKLDFLSAYKESFEIVKRRKNEYTDYLRVGTFAVALRKFKVAENAFKTSLELNPKSWEGHYNLGELYMSSRMKDAARDHYKSAVENNSGSYKPLNGLGLFSLMVDKDPAAAIRLFSEALELAPSQPEPRLNIALAYAKKRDFPKAEKFAVSVLNLVKPDDRIYFEAQRLRRSIRQHRRIQG